MTTDNDRLARAIEEVKAKINAFGVASTAIIDDMTTEFIEADAAIRQATKAKMDAYLKSPEHQRFVKQDAQFGELLARQLEGVGMDAWTPKGPEELTPLALRLGIDPTPLKGPEIQREVMKAIRELPKTSTGDEWSKLTKTETTLVRYLLTCSNWESTITNAMKVMGKQASSARDTKSFDKAVQRTNNDLLEHYPAYEIERPQRSKSIRLVKSA
ncbi:MAG: hypothetical protein EXS16_05115 [Gemmataceae bacterium]|nr:hypothetical protein [Gemmataceae bacterium]